MTNLKAWQNKIKEKRKQTSFRDFLMEIVSCRVLWFSKQNGIVSIFPDSDRIGDVVSHSEYYKDENQASLDYNHDMNFFDNYKKLYLQSKKPAVFHFWDTNNSEFSDQIVDSSNCYLSFVVIKDCEDIFYSFSVKGGSSNVFNSLMVWNNCQYVYFSNAVLESFNIFYSRFVNNSSNIWLSTNMTWCHECILCSDLDNCSYYIENKKYEKEEYLKKKAEILSDKKMFLDRCISLSKASTNAHPWSNNVSWVYNIESNNLENAYFNYQLDTGRNTILVWWQWLGENIYDTFTSTPPENDIYGCFSVWFWSDYYCSCHIPRSHNIYYSYFLDSCSFCIWCIWLKNKSYCILNKQYSKEEWEVLADKIFSQMDQDGTLWKFFPWELNPFYFNDTMAWILGDFTKEEVEAKWYLWRDKEVKVDIPASSDVISVDDLKHYEWYDAEWKWTINPTILTKVIKDEKWDYYRIVQAEYDFLQKHSLPLPSLHWLDRIKLNFWV